MTRRDHLENLRSLACAFIQDRLGAAQHATELGAAVVSLDGVLPDHGKAIAFAIAALLAARCSGMRDFYFCELDREIRAAFRAC